MREQSAIESLQPDEKVEAKVVLQSKDEKRLILHNMTPEGIQF